MHCFSFNRLSLNKYYISILSSCRGNRSIFILLAKKEQVYLFKNHFIHNNLIRRLFYANYKVNNMMNLLMIIFVCSSC